MLVKVKILRTHKRAENPRTVHFYEKDQVIFVSQEYAAEITKDKDGEIEEVLAEEIVKDEVKDEVLEPSDEINVGDIVTLPDNTEVEIVKILDELEEIPVQEIIESKPKKNKKNSKYINPFNK